jgi:DNA-binding CsgD family transcriptional regulator
MSVPIVIILASAYSICLIHITLFIGVYIKHKNRIELFYLLVLINIFLLAIVTLLSYIYSKNNVIPILVNSSYSLYITVPVYSYCLFDVDKKYHKIIPILVGMEAGIDNILLRLGILGVLYILKIVFYILITIPIFINKEKRYKKNSPEWNMQTTTKITIVIFVTFAVLLIPFSKQIFVVSFVSSLFWTVFTLLYQMPGIVYYINRLPPKNAFGKTGVSLTKRENEVALAICNGYKYEEIAQNMHISLSTVKRHSFNLYRKLDINNNRELMQLFMEDPKSSAETEK